jgi:hypothetical protein
MRHTCTSGTRANGASRARVAAETTTTATAIAFSREPGGVLVSVPLSCNLEPVGVAIYFGGDFKRLHYAAADCHGLYDGWNTATMACRQRVKPLGPLRVCVTIAAIIRGGGTPG